MNENSPASTPYFSPTTHALVVFSVFLLMLMLLLAFRDADLLLMISKGEIITSSEYSPRVEYCRTMSHCLRVLDAWAGISFEWILIEGSRLLDLLPNRVIPEQLSLAVKESYLIIAAVMLTRLFGLAPIIFAVFAAYRNLTTRLLFMFAAFMSLYGWARSNPLFSEMGMGSPDFWAVGYVCLLFALMVKGYTRSFPVAALMLIFGQMILENIGILTGVAVVLHNFLADRSSANRWRTAVHHIIGYAVVSVVAVIIVYYSRVSDDVEQLYGGVGFLAYFQFFWENWGQVNFQEFHDIRENFFDMQAYPVASGILLGLLAGGCLPGEEKDVSRVAFQFQAALSLWIGFMCTLVVAMFVSGLYYEMGRQLLPLSVLSTLMTAKGIELLIVRYRSRDKLKAETA